MGSKATTRTDWGGSGQSRRHPAAAVPLEAPARKLRFSAAESREPVQFAEALHDQALADMTFLRDLAGALADPTHGREFMPYIDQFLVKRLQLVEKTFSLFVPEECHLDANLAVARDLATADAASHGSIERVLSESPGLLARKLSDYREVLVIRYSTRPEFLGFVLPLDETERLPGAPHAYYTKELQVTPDTLALDWTGLQTGEPVRRAVTEYFVSVRKMLRSFVSIPLTAGEYRQGLHAVRCVGVLDIDCSEPQLWPKDVDAQERLLELLHPHLMVLATAAIAIRHWEG